MDNILCYICYEQETNHNPYMKEPLPCKCKGSIMIHKQCLEEVLNNSRICTICKTKYNIKYLPNKNGLELIMTTDINGYIAEYTVNDMEETHGECIVKRMSGKLLSKTTYNNGKIHGKYTSWHSNGQKQCECYCTYNCMDGEYNSWYENGVRTEQSNYKDGVKDGISKRWDENGKLVMRSLYKNGELTDMQYNNVF